MTFRQGSSGYNEGRRLPSRVPTMFLAEQNHMPCTQCIVSSNVEPNARICTQLFSSAQMTAFVALLSLDACRQKAGRVDWCCCFTNKAYLKAEVRSPNTVFHIRLGLSRKCVIAIAQLFASSVICGRFVCLHRIHFKRPTAGGRFEWHAMGAADE